MTQKRIGKRWRWLFGLFVTLTTLLFGIHVSADGLAFSVQPVLPTQQVNQKVTYFDLKMNPREQTTLVVNVHNNKKTPLHLRTGLAQATTNLNGVVEYGKNKERLDDSVPADFAKVVKLPAKPITIDPNGDGQVRMQVIMPKKHFNGQLAGGLTLSDADADNAVPSSNKQQAVAIQNRYQFVVAIVLRNSVNKVSPKLSLGTVKPKQINARNVVSGAIHNETATFVNQLKVTGEVKRADSQAALYTTKQVGYQLAPNAVMQFPVWLKNRPLSAGRYTLTITAVAQKRRWQFSKNFKVTAQKAKHLNRSSVEVKPDNTWRNVAIGAGSGATVLAGMLAWVLIRRRR